MKAVFKLNNKKFLSFEEAHDFWAGLPLEERNDMVEMWLGDFYWEIDLTNCKYGIVQHECKFCGRPTEVDPADQSAPVDYCDH